MDFNIICFQHCRKYVYCKKVPDNCPICERKLENTYFKMVPFSYPSPFKNAAQYPCSVVLKPTNGDFIHNYNSSDDLHIGITKSDGTVIEFDENGLTMTRTSKWNSCLVLYESLVSWHDYWDSAIEELLNENCWTSKNYDEENNNCFTFVLSFLQKLNCGHISNCAKDKYLFCEEFVLPRTTIAARYVFIFRQLKNQDFVIGMM